MEILESVIDRLFALAEKLVSAAALAAGIAIERARRLRRPTQPPAPIPAPLPPDSRCVTS